VQSAPAASQCHRSSSTPRATTTPPHHQARLTVTDTRIALHSTSSETYKAFLISPPARREAQARRAYVLLLFKNILVINVRSIIATSTGPIFTKFAGLVELWL